MTLISVSNLKKSYITRLLFEGVKFEINEKDRIGLIGVNGCGKTTLFRILTGSEQADEGELYINREARIGMMEQAVDDLDLPLFDYTLLEFRALIGMEEELEQINRKLTENPGEARLDALIRRQHSVRERYEDGGGLTFRSRTRSTLLGLGFSEEQLNQELNTMSGGQRSKAQLARVLLSAANLLLLDEPTNHLDIRATEWLEEFLTGFSGAFIVISHDRYFLDKVTNRTFELRNQKLDVSEGNYTRHTELKSTERELALRRYKNAKKEIERIYGIVEQQRRWGQEHNFVTAEAKLKQIERLKKDLVEPERDPARIRFSFTAKEAVCSEVVRIEGLTKSFDKTLLFKDLNLLIHSNEKVFLLGPNGCGKTTLLKILVGQQTCDSGTAVLGSKIKAGYYEQHISALNPDNTVLNEVWDEYYANICRKDICNALAAFLFRGDDINKKISCLSGGEQARIRLLKLMLSRSNLLLLDEPTNHLDINSREALESALEDYGGTILAVTHDRYLVNRLADRILYMDETGLTEYIGGYDDFLQAAAQQKTGGTGGPEVKKQSAYDLRKERRSAVNRTEGEIERIEKRLKQAESELFDLESKAASREIASDYVKAMEIAKTIEEKKLHIEKLYIEWDKAMAMLDNLKNGDPAGC